MEFLMLNIFFFILVLLIIIRKEYNSSLVIYYIGIIILFVTPSWYMEGGGEKYRSYSSDSAYRYYMLGVGVIIQCYLIIAVRFLFSKVNDAQEYNLSFKPKKPLLIFFCMVIFFIFCYVAYYWSSWPLLQAFEGNIIDRPDAVKGDFKGYFTYSIVAQTLLPAIYFYFHNKYKDNFFINTVLFLSVSFFIIIGGNKAIFLYFVIFYMWFSESKNKKLNILIYGGVCIALYALMKGILSHETGSNVTTDYLFESIVTRTFATQGISIPNVIELASNNIAILDMSSEELKSVLFEYVYGYSPGTMPLIYIADIFVRFGILITIMIGLIFSLILAFSSLFIERTKNLALLWIYYYAIYALVMSGLSDANLLRFTVSSISILIIYLFSRRTLEDSQT
ncbi:hypothetical protein [Serratia fonticola]|uniref:hypothetical protein n=1 Tax=Serratia fonticola TaxID=47917 RepID=UPI003BB696D6